MKITTILLDLINAFSSRMFQRRLVVLPLDWKSAIFNLAQNGALIPLRYSHRASPDGWVTYEFLQSGNDFAFRLHTMAFSNGRPSQGDLCFSLRLDSIRGGDVLSVNIRGQKALLNGENIPLVLHLPTPARKHISVLEYSNQSVRFRRTCSHYAPDEGKATGYDYYFGDDYVDYILETDVPNALELMTSYRSGGLLLDIGCALGIYVEAFLNAGFDAYGLDISRFAIDEASKKVGRERVRVCDLDEAEIPFTHSFDVFWMWDMLEHSREPASILKKITNCAHGGSYLFLHTSNASSLTHKIFGSDWEGYSDYSHHGVGKINARNLRQWLDELGWEIIQWQCDRMWLDETDPANARLVEVFTRFPELSTLMKEQELGDLILVIARKK